MKHATPRRQPPPGDNERGCRELSIAPSAQYTLIAVSAKVDAVLSDIPGSLDDLLLALAARVARTNPTRIVDRNIIRTPQLKPLNGDAPQELPTPVLRLRRRVGRQR